MSKIFFKLSLLILVFSTSLLSIEIEEESWKYLTGYNAKTTPIIQGDYILFTSQDGYIYKLNRFDKKLIWKFKADTKVYPSAKLAIAKDDTIYCTFGDKKLYAISAEGYKKWTFSLTDYAEKLGREPLDDTTYTTAVIGKDGTIYLASADRNLYAINPDGNEKWRHYAGSTPIVTNPAIDEDGNIYIAPNDGTIQAISPNGEKKWSISLPSPAFSSPTIDNGSLYIARNNNTIYKLNLSDGSEIWNFPITTTAKNTLNHDVTISNGILYIGTQMQYDLNALYAIDIETGKEKWLFNDFTGHSAIYSSVTSKNNILYFSSFTTIYALDLDGNLKWKFKITSTIKKAPAVGDNGIVYFGADNRYLYAVSPDGKIVPTTENPATENPATENPATENPTTENPATENPATNEPEPEDTNVTEEPVTEEPVIEEDDQTKLLKLYVATFNRASDRAGFNYWATQLSNTSMTIDQIASSFFDQPETQLLYKDLGTSAFIDAIYQNLFNRDSDEAGKEYWQGELDKGNISKNMFILAVMNGANGSDKDILDNKTKVAEYFTITQSANDTELAKKILENINETNLSVTNITDELDKLYYYPLDGMIGVDWIIHESSESNVSFNIQDKVDVIASRSGIVTAIEKTKDSMANCGEYNNGNYIVINVATDADTLSSKYLYLDKNIKVNLNDTVEAGQILGQTLGCIDDNSEETSTFRFEVTDSIVNLFNQDLISFEKITNYQYQNPLEGTAGIDWIVDESNSTNTKIIFDLKEQIDVIASKKGTVEEIDNNKTAIVNCGESSNSIKIKDDNNVIIKYLYLDSNIKVEKGQEVEVGDVLGKTLGCKLEDNTTNLMFEFNVSDNKLDLFDKNLSVIEKITKYQISKFYTPLKGTGGIDWIVTSSSASRSKIIFETKENQIDIIASKKGVVSKIVEDNSTDFNCTGPLENFVGIKNDDGIINYYLYIDEISLEKGQEIKIGDKIGTTSSDCNKFQFQLSDSEKGDLFDENLTTFEKVTKFQVTKTCTTSINIDGIDIPDDIFTITTDIDFYGYEGTEIDGVTVTVTCVDKE